MLVDSSVWIAYLRGEDLNEVQFLTLALEHGEPVWLAPPILQEVLLGAGEVAFRLLFQYADQGHQSGGSGQYSGVGAGAGIQSAPNTSNGG